MNPRSKDVITRSPDTMFPREEGEDAATDWGTRPSPKVKPFGKYPEDIPTRDWGNKPNPKKDPIGIKI